MYTNLIFWWRFCYNNNMLVLKVLDLHSFEYNNRYELSQRNDKNICSLCSVLELKSR